MRNRVHIPDQVDLWDRQHAQRGCFGPEGDHLLYKPNDTAVQLAECLPASSVILEIGCANGRDARYWASLNHRVFAADFSRVALEQLKVVGEGQGLMHLIHPVLHDISTGKLPCCIGPDLLDAFYARSALHIDDSALSRLAEEINTAVKPEGYIAIEGKGPSDRKISRSVKLEGHLAVDPKENGHLRRIWTCEIMRELCGAFNWAIIELRQYAELNNGQQACFVRLLAQRQ